MHILFSFSYIFFKTRDEQKEVISKGEQIRKKVEQETKENALLRSTIMQYTDIAGTVGPLVQETKKLSLGNADKIKQFNEATATYEQLRNAIDASVKVEVHDITVMYSAGINIGRTIKSI